MNITANAKIPPALAALFALLAGPGHAQTLPANPAAAATRVVPPGASAPAPTTMRVIRPVRDLRLFNGRDLSGFYTFLPSKGVNNDPERVFTVENGVIRVSGKEFGYFSTAREYAGYRLSFEVKWGEKKWPPRDAPTTQRDSGVLLHSIGPDKVWIKSIECQIQERDFGDFFYIGGVSGVVNGKREAGRSVRTEDREKPHGEWNLVEVVCDGATVTNIINGKVVNVATGVSQTRDGNGPALIKGKIVFQSEGAEVYYRNIVLKPLR